MTLFQLNSTNCKIPPATQKMIIKVRNLIKNEFPNYKYKPKKLFHGLRTMEPMIKGKTMVTHYNDVYLEHLNMLNFYLYQTENVIEDAE